MKVKELLKQVKANRYTYYNIDKKGINEYQKLYNYLKRNKEKKEDIMSIFYMRSIVLIALKTFGKWKTTYLKLKRLCQILIT